MEYPKQVQNTIKRGAKKASYDLEIIHSILDATEICHVAFAHDGLPMVQPINFGRQDNRIFLHGSLQNRMTAAIVAAGTVCLEVTLLDGLKLTKSAFHHSVNYRSVVVFGSVREVQREEDKLVGLKAIINHFVPNRWDHCRPPNASELKATRVVEITIETASAKVATAPPQENKEDYPLEYWSGTIPVRQTLGEPIPNDIPELRKIELPSHLIEFLKNNR